MNVENSGQWGRRAKKSENHELAVQVLKLTTFTYDNSYSSWTINHINACLVYTVWENVEGLLTVRFTF